MPENVDREIDVGPLREYMETVGLYTLVCWLRKGVQIVKRDISIS